MFQLAGSNPGGRSEPLNNLKPPLSSQWPDKGCLRIAPGGAEEGMGLRMPSLFMYDTPCTDLSTGLDPPEPVSRERPGGATCEEDEEGMPSSRGGCAGRRSPPACTAGDKPPPRPPESAPSLTSSLGIGILTTSTATSSSSPPATGMSPSNPTCSLAASTAIASTTSRTARTSGASGGQSNKASSIPAAASRPSMVLLVRSYFSLRGKRTKGLPFSSVSIAHSRTR